MKTLLLTILGFSHAFCLMGQNQLNSNNLSVTNLKFEANSSLNRISFTNLSFGHHVSGIMFQSEFFLDSDPLLLNLTLSEIRLRNSFHSSLIPNSTSNQKILTRDFNPDSFTQNTRNMTSNKRLLYSSLWTFTSLNYIYADLMGVMDVNLLTQYQTGTVNGVEVTPEFLAFAAAYMQLPLVNVFLPHVIKNDKVLRWVQIISGSIATLVQAGSLFVGKPTPYYILFSAIEIGTTAYIVFDALKWKPSIRK